MDLNELRKLYKEIGVEFENDVRLMRSVIYYTYVKTTYDKLTGESLREKLGDEGYRKVKSALEKKTLLSELCEILDAYIILAVNADLKQLNLNYWGYFSQVIEHYPGSATKFFGKYPNTQLALKKLSEAFANNIKTLCDRVLKDWTSLERTFADQNTTFTQLIDIKSTGSDFHKGGQQVLILTFSYAKGERRVVYKPSDLEVDCLLIGDSEAVNKIIPGFQKASLMEIFNNLIDNHLNNHPLDKLYKLPTYKILPINPGSRLKPAADGRLPIRESYGYLEYLEHSGPGDSPNSPPTYANDHYSIRSAGENQKLEFEICTKFYALCGQLAAIAGVFSICDLHMENLIVHRFLPYLIDLEVSLTKPITDVLLGTLMVMTSAKSGGALNGIAVSDSAVAPPERDSKLLEIREVLIYGQNRLWKKVRLISIDTYQKPIIEGYRHILKVINSALNGQLITPFDDWLDRLKKGVVGVLPLPTPEFEALVHGAYGHFSVNQYNTKPIEQYLQEQVERKKGESYNEWRTDQGKAPFFLCIQERYLFGDRLDMDIPVFYHRLNTWDVMDSQGEAIVFTDGDKVVDIGRKTFYFDSPLDRIIRDQLEPLSESKTCENRVASFITSVKGNVIQTSAQVKQFMDCM